MKRFLAIALAALLLLVPMMGALAEDVVLTMGSWRADDVEQMNRLLSIYKDKTGVEIQFQPTTPADYNATLRLQLDAGTGPDLMYARSYATGVELFDQGYFADCTDIPGPHGELYAHESGPVADGGRQDVRRAVRGGVARGVLQQGHLRQGGYRNPHDL